MSQRRVGLFITCLTDQFYPRVGVAVTKILEKLGCSVEFPSAQTCCGQPFFNNGLEQEARPLAERMVDVFKPFEYVVTPSGSCCAMVRQHFPELVPAGGAELASRTYEFMEFLTRVLHVDFSTFQLPAPQSVTNHYTCHLRGLGISDNAGTSLSRIKNLEFRPLERSDQCCGFGGTFAIKYPAISGAIAQDKARCIAATQASTVICSDAGCAMNISGMCHRQDVKVDVKHIAELFAEAMGLDLTAW